MARDVRVSIERSLKILSHARELNFLKWSVEKWHRNQNKKMSPKFGLQYASLHATNGREVCNCPTLGDRLGITAKDGFEVSSHGWSVSRSPCV